MIAVSKRCGKITSVDYADCSTWRGYQPVGKWRHGLLAEFRGRGVENIDVLGHDVVRALLGHVSAGAVDTDESLFVVSQVDARRRSHVALDVAGVVDQGISRSSLLG